MASHAAAKPPGGIVLGAHHLYTKLRPTQSIASIWVVT